MSNNATGIMRKPLVACARVVLLCLATLVLGSCTGDHHLSFLDPQGPVATLQRTHFLEVVALLAIFVAGPIFLLVPWFAWRYRYGNKSSRYTPRWKFSRFLEIAAWGGPIVIVILLGTLVWHSTHKLDPYRPLASNKPPLHIQVIGYDWKWLFIYPDQGIASIGVMPMVSGRPVDLEITSATVMQSFFIPALGSQIYAMGGMVTKLHLKADRPGHYMGENTMYNGNGFHTEQFRAVAMSPAHFRKWAHEVRQHGMPLDAGTMKKIEQRGTRARLARALGKKQAFHGGLYFNDVDAHIFADAVKATKSGVPLSSLVTERTHAKPTRGTAASRASEPPDGEKP